MDKKKRKENKKESLRIWEILTKRKRNGYCNIVSFDESARRRAIAIKNVRVWVFLLVLAARRLGDVYEGGTFEISIWNSRGYRYASCFPPAITAGFPFLFVFTGTFLPTPVTRLVTPRNGVERSRRQCDVALSRYFTTFCFLSAGRRCWGIMRHLGPYSIFMTLNRDEVFREWTTLLRFLLPSSVPSLSYFLSRDVQSCLLLAIIAIFNFCEMSKDLFRRLKEFLTFTYSLKLLE